MAMAGHIVKGNFSWKKGLKDSEVIWSPSKNGRFNVSWLPPVELQNNIIVKNGIRFPGNDGLGAFGCDPYDISGTVGGGGSNGALHGLTTFSMVSDVPNTKFFLEYIARPQTAELFYEDVLMACHFYGMPILVENNKPRLLYYLKNRGYRAFAMNRPDKLKNDLSKSEKELGGIPSSQPVISVHAEAIEAYIERNVGVDAIGMYREMGDIGKKMYFMRTLKDWSNYNIFNRTKFDATISSGLAIMACNKNRYYPVNKIERKPISLGFKKYNNEGTVSKIIK